MTRHLTADQIIMLHAALIERTGGATGVRDRGLIESALGRLLNGYYADVVEEAACLWESLSQNHPFIDGNKRAALAATEVFLRLNGVVCKMDNLEAYNALIALYEAGTVNQTSLEALLRQWIQS